MTAEKLKEATKLADEIQALELFLKVIHEHCMKWIVAYRTGSTEPATLNIEPELQRVISAYLEQRLAELKKKFEEA